MKKYLYLIIIMSALLFPVVTHAASLGNVSITVNKEQITSGQEITMTIKGNVNGLQATEGIWLAGFEVMYNKDLLILTKINSPGYSTYYVDDDKLTVVSEAIENSGVTGMCVDGYLHCGPYLIELTFYAKNVENLTYTNPIITEFGFLLLNITEEREYTLDDAIEVEATISREVNFTIIPANTTVSEPPKAATKNQSSSSSSKGTTKTEDKSNNNYLANLIIGDYEIEFNKETLEYNLKIANDINFLSIDAQPESSKATVEVLNNKKLKNNSTIIIKVIAEDGSIKEYKLNIKKEVEKEVNWWENAILKLKNINKNIVYISLGGVGLTILIIIGIVIKRKINDREIDKLLKDFDKN